MSVRTYRIIDLFCDAGGSSAGAIRAIKALGGEIEYEFTGNVGEVTRQIGNAVPVHLAEALVMVILGEAVQVRTVSA
jgi:site-specific DNA-cytosine methylase